MFINSTDGLSKGGPLGVVDLSLAGLGFILYSPFAVAHIHDGEEYLSTRFWEPRDVANHVNQGTLTAVGTGSPGNFTVRLFAGGDETLSGYEYKLALCLEIRDSTLCIRDLYDLMDWEASCPNGRKVQMPDGL